MIKKIAKDCKKKINANIIHLKKVPDTFKEIDIMITYIYSLFYI